jgi:hypothetical protein
VTPELEAVILHAIEKKPEHRFASAKEFLRAVRHVRGRETGDIFEDGSARQPNRIKVGTQELVAPTIHDTSSENNVTQPIKSRTCPVCGAATESSDTRCRQCGHGLVGSSATVKLTKQESDEWRRQRSFGLWLGLAICALALVGLVVYFARRNAAPTGKPETQTSPIPATTPVPESSLVEIKAARTAVDSSYDGYSSAPLTDGETDVRHIALMKYKEGNWASEETPTPHWIELSFEKPRRLAAVYVYWGFDRNRFMPSRHVELQVADESGQWQTVAQMGPDKDYDRMAFEFPPVTTTRARIFQPAQAGPPGRPFIMWVREVKVFSVAEENSK